MVAYLKGYLAACPPDPVGWVFIILLQSIDGYHFAVKCASLQFSHVRRPFAVKGRGKHPTDLAVASLDDSCPLAVRSAETACLVHGNVLFS